MERILAEVRGLTGLLELAPQPGSHYPAISWGDSFFYYSPSGEVPGNRQPFATIVVKNYPDDARSRLDAPGRWRLNIHVGSRQLIDLIGRAPAEFSHSDIDFSETDVFLPHPVYATNGWVCVVNPGPATTDRAVTALREAYHADRRRVDRAQRRRHEAAQAAG